MKRLILFSLLDEVDHALADKASWLSGRSVTWIPTAANVEDAPGLLDHERQRLEGLGLSPKVLDVSVAPKAQILRLLEKNDAIYISGGNTFYLLWALKKSGAFDLIRRAVNAGVPYLGESAGAAVVCPDVAYVKGMDDPELAPHLESTEALNLVPFTVLPHLGNPVMGPAAQALLESGQAPQPLVTLTDQEFLLVEDGAFEKFHA